VLANDAVLVETRSDLAGLALLSSPSPAEPIDSAVYALHSGYLPASSTVKPGAVEVSLSLVVTDVAEIQGTVKSIDGSIRPGASVFARPVQLSEDAAIAGGIPIGATDWLSTVADAEAKFSLRAPRGAYLIRAATANELALATDSAERSTGELLVHSGDAPLDLTVAPAFAVRARFVYEDSGELLRRPLSLAIIPSQQLPPLTIRDGGVLLGETWVAGLASDGPGDVQRILVQKAEGKLPDSLKFLVSAPGIDEFACTLRLQPISTLTAGPSVEVVNVPVKAGSERGGVTVHWQTSTSPLAGLFRPTSVVLVVTLSELKAPIFITAKSLDLEGSSAVFDGIPVGDLSGSVRFPGMDTQRFSFAISPGGMTEVRLPDSLRAEGLVIRATDVGGSPLPDLVCVGSADSIEGEAVAYPIDGSPPVRRRLTAAPEMRWPLRRLGSEALAGSSADTLRYFCALPPGRWKLNFGHPGFEPVTKEVERRAGELLDLTVIFSVPDSK
jgi:hypothetical protein